MPVLSIGVPLALHLRSVRKRFCAGAGACLASADVLRGVDLEVDRGESVAIVGREGAGKSTLLLCAAGLLKVESGTIEWFGERSTAAAAAHAQYYYSASDLRLDCPRPEPQLHLLDLHSSFGAPTSLNGWIHDRCARGDAVVIATRDEHSARRAVERVLTLYAGALRTARAVHSRVAEQMTG